MPLSAFRCPHDPDSWSTLKDCSACPNRCAPMPVLRAIWDTNIDEGHYHADPKVISVTQTLGCIRKGFLTAVHQYTEAPVDLVSRFIGTAVHAQIERSAEGVKGERAETVFRSDLGDGFSFAGSCDHISQVAVTDFKVTSYVPAKIKPEHEEQAQIYRAMDGASPPPEVCYIGFGSVETYLADLPEDDEALQRALARAKLIKQAIMGEIEQSALPAEGLDRKFGTKTECDYCPVSDFCEAHQDGES